eukprot:scaffold24_cov341-Pavlova_lutheri.AAC.63
MGNEAEPRFFLVRKVFAVDHVSRGDRPTCSHHRRCPRCRIKGMPVSFVWNMDVHLHASRRLVLVPCECVRVSCDDVWIDACHPSWEVHSNPTNDTSTWASLHVLASPTPSDGSISMDGSISCTTSPSKAPSSSSSSTCSSVSVQRLNPMAWCRKRGMACEPGSVPMAQPSQPSARLHALACTSGSISFILDKDREASFTSDPSFPEAHARMAWMAVAMAAGVAASQARCRTSRNRSRSRTHSCTFLGPFSCAWDPSRWPRILSWTARRSSASARRLPNGAFCTSHLTFLASMADAFPSFRRARSSTVIISVHCIAVGHLMAMASTTRLHLRSIPSSSSSPSSPPTRPGLPSPLFTTELTSPDPPRAAAEGGSAEGNDPSRGADRDPSATRRASAARWPQGGGTRAPHWAKDR